MTLEEMRQLGPGDYVWVRFSHLTQPKLEKWGGLTRHLLLHNPGSSKARFARVATAEEIAEHCKAEAAQWMLTEADK